jgi:AraC family transcriptional regulator
LVSKDMNPISLPFRGQTLLEFRSGGLCALLASYASGRQPLHVHGSASFSVLVAGQGNDRSRTGSYDQPPLTAVFHPTSEPHANDLGPHGVLGFTLEMTPAWLLAQGFSESDLGGYCVIEPSVMSRLACLGLVGGAVRADSLAAADLESHAFEFIAALSSSNAPRSQLSPPRWLFRGEEFLRNCFRDAVGLKGAAHEAGVHPVHFARVFRDHFGCPVTAYVRALRLAEAGMQILVGSQSLAEIAVHVGFADQAHLTRTFGRTIGCSPGALRQLRRLWGCVPENLAVHNGRTMFQSFKTLP